MIDYAKTLNLLKESSFSRDPQFVYELVEEVNDLLKDSNELITSKIENVSVQNLEEFEKQITELRFIKTKLKELLKVK